MAKLFSARSYWPIALVLTVVSLITSSCEFRTPATKVPRINDNGELIQKSFFYRDGNFSSSECSDQTYHATWAPIDERGILAEYFLLNGVPKKMHLNIQWCITRDALIGYQINPSFPNQREHAKAVIEIPISKHYYYEKEKDSYHRDTNKLIKNDDRDAWMHTPFMDLDFASIRVNDWAYSIFWRQPAGIEVSDIEWDKENNFLAFTVQAHDAVLPEHAQTRFRFNFKAFNSKPDFKPTPYHPSLARHLNVLHVLGKTVEGEPVAYAGHWDVRKPVTFYTHGVPAEYMDVVQDSIEEWNAAFVRTGIVPEGQKALLLDTKPLKYALDIRAPVINWVSDKRESMYSPLGIGMASSDVTNGEFLYGSVTIWGGLLEEIMNRYSVGETSSFAAFAAATGRPQHIDRRTLFNEEQLSRSLKTFGIENQSLASYVRTTGAHDRLRDALGVLAEKDAWFEQNALENNPEVSNEMREELRQIRESQLTRDAYLNFIDQDLLPEVKEQDFADMLSVFHSHFSAEIFDAPAQLDPVVSVMSAEQQLKIAQDAALSEIHDMASAGIQDWDRTIADVVPGLIEGMRATGKSERQILRAAYKFVIMHEIGHVLGLGHNFQGNIMPEKEKVSTEHYERALAQSKKGFVANSVMDYYNGRTEAIMSYEDMTIGSYDEQMLRYLYKAEYPTLVKANGKLVEKYFPIPSDGIVPEITTVEGRRARGKVAKNDYKLGFMPQCNDIEASTNVNPYCNRFDRGDNAVEIMVNRFKDFNSGLMAMLNAFSTSKGGNDWQKTGMIWYRVLSEFSQIRAFYDYMRLLLDEQPEYRSAFDRISDDQEALLAFSEACRDPNLAPPAFKNDFAKLALKNPADLGRPLAEIEAEHGFTKVRDLCVANKYALDQFAELMKRKGSDYTTYDRMHRYVPGGLRGGDLYLDWGYIWGAFRELGSFPVRLSTLYMVTSPVPFFVYGGMYPVPLYSNPQGLYSYAPLYPREYGSIIDTTVRENLNLGGGELEEKTEMGKSLMYVSYLMYRNRLLSKDNDNRFPAIYLDNLTTLTDFQIQLSPIILSNIPKEGKRDTLAFGYSATYIDLSQRDAISIPYAYLLTDRRVIAQGNEKQMFLPITRFRYLSDRWGYVWALDLKYHNKNDDPLKGYSVKYGLDRMAQQQLEACAQGGTGLSSFFNITNENFDGFEVGTGIAVKPDLQQRYDDSVKRAFAKYYTQSFNGVQPDRKACDDTLRSMNLIVGGAAMINGYWLPQAIKYLNF